MMNSIIRFFFGPILLLAPMSCYGQAPDIEMGRQVVPAAAKVAGRVSQEVVIVSAENALNTGLVLPPQDKNRQGLITISEPVTTTDLIRISLVTDGSADPPGDRIDLAIRFDSDATELEILVRGFVISGESNEFAKPLGGQTEGEFLARTVVKRDSDSLLKDASVVIPYKSLSLGIGIHSIAYEVTGMRAKQVLFVQPTELTRMEVTNETRHKIRVTKTEFKEKLLQRSQKILIAGARVRGEQIKSVLSQIVGEQFAMITLTFTKLESCVTFTDICCMSLGE
ncbi:hypothetical protein N9L06_06435 [Mariniblastus sp.]|nr:hypothetical protein [Mariniblastus sp.]